LDTLPPEAIAPVAESSRPSDAVFYAIARYVTSLTPPANPNLPRTTDEQRSVNLGADIFEREDCARCHERPLYTNNKLTPAGAFQIPPSHRTRYRLLEKNVGTDPRSATVSDRGRGYYKVPSLLGVWYRGPFEHNGSIATLEDWFDQRRLQSTYVPTGFKGYKVNQRAVPGHRFGLDLTAEEKRALIAFLKTL
jgi:cytochrome c peroxidase